MAKGVRKRVTSRFRPTDLFSRRVVITIPRSGVITITIAVILGLRGASLSGLLSIVALVCTVVAVATTIEARHQLRAFRYELPIRLSSVVAAYQIPDADLRIAHELGLLDDDDESEDRAPFIRFRSTKSN
jgi:hypothetical protein